MPCKPKHVLPRNGFILPPNREIAVVLINKLQDIIIGTSRKAGVTYRLPPHDLEDMRQAVLVRFLAVDWRSVFRRNTTWLQNIHHPNRHWTAEECAAVLKGYATQSVPRLELRTAWQLRNSGMTGLGGKEKIDEVPNPDSHDDLQETGKEPSVDGQATRTAAKQMADVARDILDPEEWSCLSLQFGFDGGGSRSVAQIAREAKLPRKRTQELLDSAMEKLKARVNR
jgi:DNA-directed RNA polymerase sigma subunit (sigma70/sigma32)